MTTTGLYSQTVPLKGALNFRDMGGLVTVDGRKVRSGIIYRAGDLSGLTTDDIAQLSKQKIKYIFDYRREDEANEKPDPEIGSAKLLRVPVIAEDNIAEQVSKVKKKEDVFKHYTKETFLTLYSTFPVRNASYQALMNLLKEPEKNLPLIHHCAGGRDRTGIGAMIILLTLGVPFSTVMEDYLYSNVALAAFHEQMFLQAEAALVEEDFLQLKAAFLLQEEYLLATKSAIEEIYGDFDTYLYLEFGITNEIRKKIKDFCLQE
ncbi:tyrosine-protein phosphatase [Cytobacillus kochii]|uniref:tyrosine-protein phosphatase n=1 Tax=Cytobacillus kochii TaxID=859143 RepID=UPI002E1EF9A1|nr:tyrosine-protein phosphatase [Cytobacillus kochii]